jgi:serine phosphatase RsbU (regulator of sigma subunit)
MNMIAKTPAAENAVWNRRKNYSEQRASANPKLRVGRKSSASKSEPDAESATSLKQELDTVRQAHAQLQQAIYEAAQVQRKLCAPRELAWGAFEIAGESFPVRHLSGDFFKVMELGAVLGLALGDIAGKGLSAGIWQTHLVDLVQRCAKTHANPADAVAGINRELCQDLGEPPLTALFFARLDPERNELVYCNAGLPPPLVLRHDNSVERLGEGGPMLGALQQALYSSGTVRLNPGDMLLTYSDGLTECQNPQEEEFEMERLSAAAKAVRGASANQVLFSTLATVLDFAASCPPTDDLTLLVVRHRDLIATEQNETFSPSRRRSRSVARPGQARNRPDRLTTAEQQ